MSAGERPGERRPGGGPGEEGPLSFEPDPWAHRADPDLEDLAGGEPKPDVPPPARPTGSRYGWIVGVLAVLIIGYITLNTLRTEGLSTRGLEPGRPLPPFAVPLALSDLEGDANIAREQGGGQAGKVPACEVRGSRILNICALEEKGPVVLAFFATRGGGECVRQLDRMERARRRFPAVGFAAVAIRGDRGDVRRLVRDHGWSFPVGFDRDGLVSTIYEIRACPTTTFATKGGIVSFTHIGKLDDAGLGRAVARLERRSRAQ